MRIPVKKSPRRLILERNGTPGLLDVGRVRFRTPMTPHAKNELLVVIRYSDAPFVKEFSRNSGRDKDSVANYPTSISSTLTGSPVSFERFAASTTARVRTASG